MNNKPKRLRADPTPLIDDVYQVLCRGVSINTNNKLSDLINITIYTRLYVKLYCSIIDQIKEDLENDE